MRWLKLALVVGVAVIGALLAMTIIFKSKHLFRRSFSENRSRVTSTSARSSLHSNGDATVIVNVIGRNSGQDLIMKSNFRAGKNKVEWSPRNIVDSTETIGMRIIKNTDNLILLKRNYLKYAGMEPNSPDQITAQQQHLKLISYKIKNKLYENKQLNEAKTRLTDYAMQNKKLLENYKEIKDTMNDAINNSPKKSVTFDDNIVK